MYESLHTLIYLVLSLATEETAVLLLLADLAWEHPMKKMCLLLTGNNERAPTVQKWKNVFGLALKRLLKSATYVAVQLISLANAQVKDKRKPSNARVFYSRRIV
jgi:hypothetical protein